MAGDTDELEINPFYIALQSKYADLYEKAQKNCYLLCVPREGSFSSQCISTDFTETHILRPSPYFKGQFLTTHPSNSKTIIMSEDGQYFTSSQGFEDTVTVKIISEELAYNKEYQQYRILILEKPLDSRFQLKGPQNKEKREKQLHSHKVTFSECSEFIKSFPEFKAILETLDGSISYFCSHYMVLPDYLDDALARLKTLNTQTQKEMLRKLNPTLNTDTKLREVLAGATESYIMGAVYQKVFVVIRQKFSSCDQLLLSKCQTLNLVKPEDIGVRKEFSCPLPMAIVELANLGTLVTPREKLNCLKSTVDHVTESIAVFLKERKQSQSFLAGIFTDDFQEACITSDDLIPILVTVIAKAKCSHLYSELFYIENFMWESTDQDRDDLGYCLVSFKAAAQYMMETDFSHLQDSALSSDKEISIEDLIAVTKLRDEVGTSADIAPASETKKRRDRQLIRISELLEQATREMGHHAVKKEQGQIQSIFPDRVLKSDLNDSTPPQDRQNDRRSELGDFLSALQNDEFDQHFGKQY